jgi:hypothetical protein
MPEDALAALQAAAQRRRASTGGVVKKKASSSAASRPAAGGSRRASAPVVPRQVREERWGGQGAAGGACGRKLPAGRGARIHPTSSLSAHPSIPQGSAFSTCPVCGASVAAALLAAHANECLDLSQRSEGRDGSAPPPPPPEEAQQQVQQHHHPPRPSALAALMASARGSGPQPPGRRSASPPPPPPARTVPGTGPADPAKPSALAALMAAQREAGRVHTLYAEWRPQGGGGGGGAWFWHWAADKKGAAGLPPPSWTGEAAVSLAALAPPDDEGGGPPPVATKVALRLATNVFPGEGGGAGRVPSGPPGPYPPPHGALAPPRPPPTSTSTPVSASPSVLKSALQKNVRLGRGAPAVRLALHMLRTEPGEFLRRVCVVMVEDVLLHPALPLCVWAMAAHSKGFTLPRSAVSALLRVVWQLAACRVRDDPAAWAAAPRLALDGLFAEGGGGSGEGTTSAPSLASQLPPESRLLVRALALRAAYGGMACDVALLRDAAGVWAARLAGAAGFPPALEGGGGDGGGPPPIPTDDPGAAWLAYAKAATVFGTPPPPPGLCDAAGVAAGPPPAVGDVPLSAIDFHVCGIADDAMLLPSVAAAAAAAAVRAGGEGAGVDGPERLRRAIWVFRSSINRRARVVPLPPSVVAADKAERADLLPLWRVASGPLDAWAVDFIRSRFPAG